MEFHQDYYKLEKAASLMEKIPKLIQQINYLESERSHNSAIISSNWQSKYRESTYYYDLAYKRETDRVAAAKLAAQKKRSFRNMIISAILQFIALIAMIILSVHNLEGSFYCIEYSVIIMILTIYTQYKNYRKNITDSASGISVLIPKIVSIILVVSVFIFNLDISFLGGIIVDNITYEGTILVPIIGMIQSIIAGYFVFTLNKKCRAHAVIDQAVLDKARAVDERSNKRRQNELKEKYESDKNTAKLEIRNINAVIKQCEAEIANLKSEIAAIGILNRSEYDNPNNDLSFDYMIATKYAADIYSETMQTGRMVDVEYARYTESKKRRDLKIAMENAKMADEMRKQQQTEEFFARMDRYYDRQETRRKISDLEKSIDNYADKTKELTEELKKFRD